MPDERLSIVRGEILFGTPVELPPGSNVYVRLEDVSMIDTYSKVVSEQSITGINHEVDTSTKLNFEIQGMTYDDHSYSIRVHVDIDGDGNMSKGDFINMQSYPVLTHGHPNFVSVIVKEIK
jgi:uncharacterized lipoprotein YbaY